STGDELSGEALHSEHLRLRVTPVARRTLSFFMSHGILLSRPGLDGDAVDADLDGILTMTVGPLGVVLGSLLLENDDLLAAGLAENRGDDRRAGHRRRSDLRLVAADHEHFTERDLVLIRRTEHVALDAHRLTLSDSILLPTGTNDGVHNDLREIGPRVVAQCPWAVNATEAPKRRQVRDLFRLALCSRMRLERRFS